MISLESLEIDVQWKFRTIPSQHKVEAMHGTIFCDLGGKLATGVIDPHGRGYLSATAAIAAEPHLVLNHLLGPLNNAYHSGQDINIKKIEFQFCVSRSHWDGLCCFVLCDYLVRIGVLPSWTKQLVESANKVDHGKIVLSKEQLTAPLLMFYALNAEYKDNVEKVFPQGLELICKVGEFHTKSKTFKENPFFTSLPKDSLFDSFNKLGELNEQDFSIFSNEFKDADEFEVKLPCRISEGQPVQEKLAKCLMFKIPPQSRLFVHWSRSRYNFDLLVVPSMRKGMDNISRWTISVDPSSKFHLYRLGYRLEEEETKARKDFEMEVRGGEPRWGDSNYSNNDDPWYDGRDHEFTLVDSPRSGTVFDRPEVIKRILKSRFYGVNLNSPLSTKISKPRFISYMFFEIDKGEKTFSKLKEETYPFSTLSDAFTYVKQISFFQPSSDFQHPDEHLAEYSLKLYASSITNHAVLEIESLRDINDIILEDIPEFVNQFGKNAIEIGKWVEQEFNLKSEVWGRMGFSLLLFMDPDLNFHDDDKIRRILGDLTNYPVSLEEVRSMKNQPKGNDIISSSTSVCVLRQSSSNTRDEDRRLIALYALFIKTAYRRFSQRLEPLTKNEDLSDALDQILQIQRDFSRFLASNDFSGTEISLDGDITNFFESISKSLALEEQKQETNLEMQLVGNLASSFENREQAKRTNQLSRFVVILSLFAVCDFIYAFSSDYLSSPSDSLPKLGLTLGLVSLLGLVASFSFIRKKNKKRD